MKNEQLVLNFRKAFRKLNYDKNKLTVVFLEKWSNTWCRENGIPQNLYLSFRTLATAYAEQEINENYLPRELKKIRIDKSGRPV